MSESARTDDGSQLVEEPSADVSQPPEELVIRVGTPDPEDFRRTGEKLKQQVLELLPPAWSFEAKRVLDFGCGSGRLLVHFLPEAATCEFHACDIDEPSVAWLEQQIGPSIHVFQNDEEPPLPFADGSLDLVIAISVFTHLGETWSRWLVEMQRVLADDGLLIATFLGRELIGMFDEDWDDDRIGMNVLRPLQSWDLGGPMVFHSAWWLREHWGRAFEVLVLRERGFVVSVDPFLEQGVVLMRKKPGRVTPAELEAIDLSDARELLALRHNIAQLGRESLTYQLRALALERELAQLEHEMSVEHAEAAPSPRRRAWPRPWSRHGGRS
jgi:SAM-dependent methyltransferase